MTDALIPPFDPARDGWPHGSERIVLCGPPGTGKTSSLLRAWLLPALRAGQDPLGVLACSFTRAAAGEICRRLASELGGEAEDYRLTSSTIHAEAYRAVRKQFPSLNLNQPRESLQPDEIDAEEEGDGQAKDQRRQTTDLERAARTVWDYARNVLAPGRDAQARVRSVWDRFEADRRVVVWNPQDLAESIERYESAKELERKIDFTDMLELALNQGEATQREILIVDEAQDLSPLQWKLALRWASHSRITVLIGDFDQAVHRWCGADPFPLIHFARDQRWVARRLDQSYRVPRLAHRLARDLILQDPERLDAPYRPAPRDGHVSESSVDGAISELAWAYESGSSALVLGRSRKVLSEGLTAAMREAGVPYVSERGYSPLGSEKAVACARAILELRSSGRAPIADLRTLLAELPARGYFPSRMKGELQIEVGAWPEGVWLSVSDLEQLGIGLGKLADPTRPLVDAFGEVSCLRPQDGNVSRSRAQDLSVLVEKHGAKVLTKHPGICVTTMHASKGREADTVVVDLEAPRPVSRALAHGEGTDDERRLVYVALTRTKDRLCLVRSPGDLGELLELGMVQQEAVA